jgi:hypothetical protein
MKISTASDDVERAAMADKPDSVKNGAEVAGPEGHSDSANCSVRI